VEITAYPSRDWSDLGAVTFVLRSQGRTVFIGGDTLYTDAFEDIAKAEKIDLAVLALGRNHREVIDQELYVDPPGLARAARTLQAKHLLPVHWDIWQGWLEDPHLIEPHLEGSGIALVILAQGESVTV
jgi:L-ascorbate metabolism protein UlaG (beta-lactamase superfamily)